MILSYLCFADFLSSYRTNFYFFPTLLTPGYAWKPPNMKDYIFTVYF